MENETSSKLMWYLNLRFLLLLDLSSSSSSLFRMIIGFYLSINMNLNMFG
ncbi:hypothetical protein ACMBCN_01460 [Candidatus Liberibacter asiaticus]|nr:hypothetical protein [Candidatus Liberibacter asiaticus]